jgi:tetratricopeptide (TPR) repeat protein
MAPKVNIKQKIILVIFGVILFFMLLEIGMRLGNTMILLSRDIADKISGAKFRGYRILCIGESTTYDGGIYSYPSQLQRILNSKNNGVRFKVINCGIPGITTDAIVAQLKDNINKYRPDIVIVMMGINDNASIKIKDIISDEKNSFFPRNLKIYKLMKLLEINIASKLKELQIVRSQHKKAENVYLPVDDLTERKILMLREVIRKDPTNPFVRLALAYYYKSQKRFIETEQMYKDVLKQNMLPDDLAKVYADLARFYWEQEEYNKIEDMYKDAIKKNPKFVRFYCDLGIYYRDRNRYRQAETMFQTALEIEPANNIIYDNFGDCYEKEGKHEEAELMYKKAKELSSGHINTAFELRGKEFREIGRYADIERLYKKILEIDPKDSVAYYQLGKCYEKQAKYIEAEEMYKKSIQCNPADYKGYGTLALFYQKLGQNENAEEYFSKAKEIKFRNFYNQKIISNYLRAKEIILGENLKLIWVQYPMWEIEPLKAILGKNDNVTFVDNEKIFKDGVGKIGYGAYFIDRFAGDFGHCTKEGNRLLSENITNYILKEFNKDGCLKKQGR